MYDSTQADGFFPGTTVVGRSPAWFFDSASPGFQPSGGSGAEEASAFVGGGVGGGAGVSRDVRELRWWRRKGGGMEACLVRIWGDASLKKPSSLCLVFRRVVVRDAGLVAGPRAMLV